MSDQDQNNEQKANDNMNFWGKQNPILYLIVVLIMGGNGAGLVTNNSLREDVQAIGKTLDNALRRIEDQERISTMYRREIDLLDRRVSDLEDRVKHLEGVRYDDPMDEEPRSHRR
jgi:hypothetical protein